MTNYEMEPFPTEIWVHIVETHLREGDWVALSYTSSFFHSLAMTALYRNIRLTTQWRGENYVTCYQQTTSFVQSLRYRPNLYLLLHDLDLSPNLHGIGVGGVINQASQHPVLSQLPYFVNLETVHIRDFLVDVEFYSTIRAHPRLASLSFRFCSLDPATAYLPIHVSLQRLRHVKIAGPRDATGLEPWEVLILPGLESLSLIQWTNTESLVSLLSRMTPDGSSGPHTFTSLTLSNETENVDLLIEQLVSVLPSLSQIKNINIASARYSPYKPIPGHRLSQDILPRFQQVSGPVSCAAIFVPGFPVHTVDFIVGEGTPDDALLPLQRSLVPLKNIALTFSEAFSLSQTNPIMISLPLEVSRLTIAWRGTDEADFTTWADLALHRLTELMCLNLPETRVGKLVEQEILQACTHVCPLIKQVRFRDYKWLRKRGGDWEVYQN